jgi:hypothetical protein
MLELDEATVAEEQYEEYREFDVIPEGSENIEDLAAEITALECTYYGCTEGEGGAKFKIDYLRFTGKIPMASVKLLPAELPVRSNFPRYQDQKSVEAAVKKTSSSLPENRTNMSNRPMRKMATN